MKKYFKIGECQVKEDMKYANNQQNATVYNLLQDQEGNLYRQYASGYNLEQVTESEIEIFDTCDPCEYEIA